jgi:long-chain acyl-CoA synthetase
VIEDASLTVVCTSEENLVNLLAVAGDCKSLKTIVVLGNVIPADTNHASGVSPLALPELHKRGENTPLGCCKTVQKGDLALILYTSGTTGTPKSVPITHETMVASAAGLLKAVPVFSNDIHTSYLPLAHVFENTVVLAGMSKGAALGFYAGNVKTLVEDIAALRPTIFIGVPRVYQRIQVSGGNPSPPLFLLLPSTQNFPSYNSKLSCRNSRQCQGL